MELSRLQPIIVPAEYYELSSWDLPHVALPNKEFILTWVDYAEAMLYLDRAAYDELEAAIPGWQQQTFDNVRQTEYFHRHHKGEEHTPEWIAFLNDEDTISSSKVLLQYEINRIFPEGYRIAIPDRACGIIVSNLCSAETLREVQLMVENMYESATTPMSPQLYPSSDFQLPAAWVQPFQTDETSKAILHLFEK